MRFAWLLFPLGVLASCGSPAILYVDDLFQASAPEIVHAWSSLGPWHNASVRNFPAGGGTEWWDAELKNLPGSTALIGAALSGQERQRLAAAYRSVHFVFFVPAAEASGQATITVDRVATWLTVTRDAARGGGSATAYFPADATEVEIRRVNQAWNVGGNVPLTILSPSAPLPIPTGQTVFQWASPDGDAQVLALTADHPVHGNPGTPRAPGAHGLTWRIQEAGLGDFLWAAVQDPGDRVHFLPLETVSTSR